MSLSIITLALLACSPTDDRFDSVQTAEWSPGEGGPMMPPPGVAPTVVIDTLVEGAPGPVTAMNADPGETVYFIVSTSGIGAGPCPGQLGGQCLDILQPQLIGSAVADLNGEARLVVNTPAGLGGTTVFMQAAMVRGVGGIDSVISTVAQQLVLTDADGDGYGVPGDDCDDGDATVHPGALDIPFDGVDSDCDPNTDDLDGDGWTPAYGDCDDTDPLVHPDAAELIDGLDQNCNNIIDEETGGNVAANLRTVKIAGIDYLFATGFRNPLGSGIAYTHANDGDDFYVCTEFYEWNACGQSSIHMGEDWNGEGGGDQGSPLYAIANGVVVDTGMGSPGWQEYVIVRHDAPAGSVFILDDGTTATSVLSMIAHVQNRTVQIGDAVVIGQQLAEIGPKAVGSTASHLHFEIGTDFSQTYPGYGYSATKRGRVDPTVFLTLNAVVSSVSIDNPVTAGLYDLDTNVEVQWQTTGIGNEVNIRFHNGINLDGTDPAVLIEVPGPNDGTSDVYLDSAVFTPGSNWYVCIDDGQTGTCTGHITLNGNLPLTVGCGNDHTTVQSAIDAASSGDTVTLCAGTFDGLAKVDGKVLTIDGEGEGVSELTAQTGPIFEARNGADVTIRDVTIRDGDCTGGWCGVYVGNGSSLLAEDVTIKDIDGTWSPGIKVSDSDATLNRVTVRNITGNSNCAGVVVFDATATATDLVVDGTVCTDLGGGIQVTAGSTATFTNPMVMNNVATVGGGLFVNDSTVVVNGGQIVDNIADEGGGIDAGWHADVTLNGTTIQDNIATSGWGGGARVRVITTPIDNTIVQFTNVDFGVPGTGENTPFDVELVDGAFNATPIDYLGVTSVTCTPSAGVCQ